ncbi:MAG: hypothetical protein WC584_01100 [Candidatus Pacearchaeota archaeon]
MGKLRNYLTDEEKSFYEKGIHNLAGLTGIDLSELKNNLYNNSPSFFKKVGKYIAENLNTKYSLEKVIDDSNLARGRKRKLKRVLLDKQETNIRDSVIILAREREFQELYSRIFIKK